jgi:hypothetical protein
VTEAHRRRVEVAYDAAAAAFERVADPLVYRFLAGPLANAVLDALGPSPGRVLDVAAGTGACGRAFGDVVALDVSAAQLRSNPSVRRVRADVDRLPFRSQAFAAVVCSFGINHFMDPIAAVGEMARLAPVVAVSTWARPEVAYAPKRIVQNALEGRTGTARSSFGQVLDELSDRVGSVASVTELLVAAGLEPCVREVEVEVPWCGSEAYVDYRLAMPSSARLVDRGALRDEVAGAIGALSEDELTWRPHVIVGLGQRSGRARACSRHVDAMTVGIAHEEGFESG